MAQNIDQSNLSNENEILDKIKRMRNDLSLHKFTSKNKSDSEAVYADIVSDDFASIKREIEEADITLSHFKYNREEK